MQGGPKALKAAKAKLKRRKNLVNKAHSEVFELEIALEAAVDKVRKAEKNHEDAEFELEVLKRKTNIEEIFWRFPHLGQNILEELDNESLVKCREVNKWWQDFVDGQRTSYIRNIEKCIGLSKMSVQKRLQKERLPILKKVSKLSSSYYTPKYAEPYRKTTMLLDLMCHQYSEDDKYLSLYLAELIIDNSEDKNPVDKQNHSVLHNIAMVDNATMYQMIMGKNTDINPRHVRYGNTPLHVAAKYNHFEVYKVIVNGLSVEDWNPKDKYGETPYDIAKTKGFKNICELFESANPKQMKNKKRRLK